MFICEGIEEMLYLVVFYLIEKVTLMKFIGRLEGCFEGVLVVRYCRNGVNDIILL